MVGVRGLLIGFLCLSLALIACSTADAPELEDRIEAYYAAEATLDRVEFAVVVSRTFEEHASLLYQETHGRYRRAYDRYCQTLDGCPDETHVPLSVALAKSLFENAARVHSETKEEYGQAYDAYKDAFHAVQPERL